MHKQIKRMFFILIVCMGLCLLSACADAESVYDHFSKYEATDSELKLLSEGKLTMDFYIPTYERGDFESYFDYMKYVVHAYISSGATVLKEYAVYICVISIFVGVGMFLLARKSIEIRRVAVMVFIIGIPVLAILAVYGTAIFADCFY